MNVVILYHPNSEHDTAVHNYARDFERQVGKRLELVDAHTKDSIALAQLHDIMRFPAILVTEEDGGFVQVWTDMESWPTYSELSYYTK